MSEGYRVAFVHAHAVFQLLVELQQSPLTVLAHGEVLAHADASALELRRQYGLLSLHNGILAALALLGCKVALELQRTYMTAVVGVGAFGILHAYEPHHLVEPEEHRVLLRGSRPYHGSVALHVHRLAEVAAHTHLALLLGLVVNEHGAQHAQALVVHVYAALHDGNAQPVVVERRQERHLVAFGFVLLVEHQPYGVLVCIDIVVIRALEVLHVPVHRAAGVSVGVRIHRHERAERVARTVGAYQLVAALLVHEQVSVAEIRASVHRLATLQLGERAVGGIEAGYVRRALFKDYCKPVAERRHAVCRRGKQPGIGAPQ